jgi:hypothetical protein
MSEGNRVRAMNYIDLGQILVQSLNEHDLNKLLEIYLILKFLK